MRRRWYRELIDEMREENRDRRAAHERWLAEFEQYKVDWRAQVEADRKEQKRRFDALDAAMENERRVTREIVLELQAGRERDREARYEMRAITEGLLRVIDRLDRSDGPSPAGA